MIFLQFLCIFLTAAAEQNITVSSVIGIAGRSDYGYSAKKMQMSIVFLIYFCVSRNSFISLGKSEENSIFFSVTG